jgi:TPR repeat protein
MVRDARADLNGGIVKRTRKKEKLFSAVRTEWRTMYDEGRLVKAFPLLLEAAKLGDEKAQVLLGYDYAYGMSGGADEQEAVRWWKRAYKQGSWDAAFNLGMFFRDTKRWKVAAKWFERAVKLGDVDGLVEVAKIHLRYNGDRPEGLRYLKLARAAKAELTAPELIELEHILKEQKALTPGNLLHMEADLLDVRGKYAAALPLLEKGAALGDEGCQILLGSYLTNGMKGVPKDLARGVYWYEQAFKGGCSLAAVNLGMTYLQEKNVDEALEWFERAVKLGEVSAHLNIAKIWFRHRGDRAKGVEHLHAMFAGGRDYSDADRDEARSMLRRFSEEKDSKVASGKRRIATRGCGLLRRSRGIR